ncbi:MAG: hypothetical protein RLY86_2364 [Pseudomonadota bacterium]
MTTSVLLSVNDLEARAIGTVARAIGISDVRDLKLDWGGRIDGSGIDVGSLGDRVLLVECPSPALEERIRASGRQVHVIDHHVYPDPYSGGLLDRTNPMSSLEQVIALLDPGRALTGMEKLVAANDRGYWPTLMATADACMRDDAGGKEIDDHDWVKAAADPLRQVTETVGATSVSDAVRVAFAIRRQELLIRSRFTHPGVTEDERSEAVLADLLRGLAFLEDPESPVVALDTGRGQGVTAGPEALTLILAPDDLRPVLGDCLYIRHLLTGGGAHVLRTLTLHHPVGKPEAPTRLFLSGSATDRPLIRDVVDRLRAADAPAGLSRLTSFAGGGTETVYFGADRGLSGTSDDIGALADLILANALGGNRPIWGWTTRMFCAVDIAPFSETGPPDAKVTVPADLGKAGFEVLKLESPERAYLLPHLRDLLAPTPRDLKNAAPGETLHVCSYRRVFAKGEEPVLHLNWSGWRARRGLRAAITDLIIHFCFNRVAILEWRFGGEEEKFREKDENDKSISHWRALLDARNALKDQKDRVATYADLLDFNEAARYFYAPYKADCAHRVSLHWPGEGEVGALCYPLAVPKTPEKPEGWLLPLLVRMLGPFGLDAAACRLILDERARVATAVAFLGAPPTLEAGKALDRNLFRRLTDVSCFDKGPPYDPDFHAARDPDLTYRRFESMGTLTGVDDHAFVIRSFGGFGRWVILGQMDTVYRRIWLVAQYYHAAFQKYSRAIAGISERRVALDRAKAAGAEDGTKRADLRDEAHQMRVGFLTFANALWFDQVSSQMQGIDLFGMMARRLGVRPLYEEIDEELDRTDTLETAERLEEEAAREKAAEQQRRETADAEARKAAKEDLGRRRVGEVAGVVAGTTVLITLGDAMGWLGRDTVLPGRLLYLAGSLLAAIAATLAGAAVAREEVKDPDKRGFWCDVWLFLKHLFRQRILYGALFLFFGVWAVANGWLPSPAAAPPTTATQSPPPTTTITPVPGTSTTAPLPKAGQVGN